MDNTWTETGASAANTAQTLTKAPESTTRHIFVTGYLVAIKAADAGADITVDLKEAGVTKWSDVIGSGASRANGRVGAIFPNGMRFAVGATVTLVVAAGGAACVTVASLTGFEA